MVVTPPRAPAAQAPALQVKSTGMLKQFVAGGLSVAFATTLTNPIDVVKVRMQMVSGAQAGLLRTSVDLVRSEGLAGLAGGLAPAVLRATTYGAIRLGAYEPVRPLFGAEGTDAPLANKIAASTSVGAFAAGVTNPLDAVKTRGQLRCDPGAPRTGPLAHAAAIVREGGVLGLWRGAVPGMLRAGVLTSAQIVTYGEAKRIILTNAPWPVEDGFGVQWGASMLTGLIATTAINPFDVLKTRMQASSGEGSGRAGVVSVAQTLAAREGLKGFFKGWSACYVRIGPQTAFTFLAYEQVRRLLGMGGVS